MADDWSLDDDPSQRAKNPLQASNTAAATTGAQNSYEGAWAAAAPASGGGHANGSAPASGTLQPSVEPQKALQGDLGVSPSLGVGAWDASSAAPSPTATGADYTPHATGVDYTPHVAAVQNATDPQDYLKKQDQLARRVATDLQAAGHEVKWQGQQLIVDGRPYEVGGQSWAGGTGPVSPEEGYRLAHASPTGSWTNAPGPLYDQFGQRNGTPQASLQQVYDSVRSQGAPTAQSLDQLMNAYATQGYQVTRPTYNGVPSGNELVVNGQKLKFTVGDAGTPGAGWYEWGTDDSAPGGRGGAGGHSPLNLGPSLAAPAPNYDALWSPSEGDPYTAGQIGNENMPGFTYESLLHDATSGNPVEASTDTAVNSLLAHPESLDAHTVAMMEAADAEEQQQAARSSDESLKRFGFQSGLSDSNWLASERASTARAADESIIKNRRQIETEAAKTNMADRRAATQIGTQYQGQRAAQKQAAVNTAVSGALQKAAETRDRFQLNENLKVEAAKLKLSKEELVQKYAVAKMDDLSKRYGINLGYDIDSKKLAEQGDEFQADLLFKLQSLDQQDKQFGANLGLNYDQLNERANEDYWNRTTTGA